MEQELEICWYKEY